MNTISVSKLKTNPSKAILQAEDLPLAVQKRNDTKAYLVGKNLYEKIVSFIEDYIDLTASKNADFSKEYELNEVLDELGI